MLRGGGERLKPPITEDQKVGSAEIAQDAGMAARQREVFEQTGAPAELRRTTILVTVPSRRITTRRDRPQAEA